MARLRTAYVCRTYCSGVLSKILSGKFAKCGVFQPVYRMRLLQKSLSLLVKKRLSNLEHAKNYPIETQERQFHQLVRKGQQTSFGKQFAFASIKCLRDFQVRVPVHTYEQLYPYIERAIRGEKQVLWPTTTRWFAQSSGTTNARSKFIPVSTEALKEGYYKAGKDMLAIYVNNYPDTHIATGKNIGLGGRLYPNTLSPGSYSQYGEISAVLMKNLPFWAQWRVTPDLETALMDQWEAKIDVLANATAKENVTCIAGLPTWVFLLLQKVMTLQNKQFIHDVWPKLELFIHGGVSFEPYRALFEAISAKAIRSVEVYNASEGFFAVQDREEEQDMLLLLDHGVFYEFIPMESMHEARGRYPRTVSLENVEIGKTYELLITTSSGLWRYPIGDVVQFTSLLPFRIRIMGRTKLFIDTFGESVFVSDTETAITRACNMTGAQLNDYTAGPRYLEASKSGSHEWIIDFAKPPRDIELFISVLDATLQEVNYNYQRQRACLLGKPVVHCAPQGIFYEWLSQRGKLGNQHKVPRLFNDRRYLDEILAMLSDT